MRVRPSSIIPLALLVSGCLGPAVPNQDFVQACQDEPANWRHQTVFADTVLTADWVNVLEPELRWTNRGGVQPGYDPCYRCASLLLRGFLWVEYLPTSSSSLDRVWRYSFATEGDPRCEFIENRGAPINHPPEGQCLAVERDVPRSARYALDLYNTDMNAQRIETWTYELVDLGDRSVVAHATELLQRGIETRAYQCRDVNIDRGGGQEFVELSIQPQTPRH